MDIGLILANLGFDWRVALANLANFLIIVWILKRFAFKPIKAIIEKRENTIKEGLDKAKEAEERLKEVDIINKGKIKDAEIALINIVKETEKRVKIFENESQKKIEEKQLQLQKSLQEDYEKQREEVKNIVLKDAFNLVKRTVIKTVELSPEDVDEALIKKAIIALKDEKTR